ncbi:hypothetical protein JW752_03090 [Candidatus Peregrinibacteria bacterium]|nr:hypothetical protein [Candidatus Peregrinibacteria bacterium]
MPEANINITDMDLLDRLKHSYIDPAQKQELEGLLPQMTNDERAKLIQLIDQADEEYRTAQVKYKEGLEGFHKELKENDEKFRKDLETVEKKEDTKEIQEFEKEIQEMTGNRPATPRETVLKQAKKKHTLRNLLLGLLTLAALAGGILYYLNAL